MFNDFKHAETAVSTSSEDPAQFAAAAAYTARLVASNAQLNAQLQLLDTQAAQSRKLAASGSNIEPGENSESFDSSGELSSFFNDIIYWLNIFPRLVRLRCLSEKFTT